MITSFEVGSIFRIIDEASPALRKILRQVRELNAVIDKARGNLAAFSKSVAPGISGAIKETDGLAASWGRVSESAKAASATIVKTAETAKLSAAAATGDFGGGGRHHRPGWLGGGGRPSLHGVHGGSVGTAALGLMGYGVYEAMQYDDAVVLMANHAGVELKQNRDKFRKMLQDAAIKTGFGEHDISMASQQELRMFQDTGGSNGVDILPKMLRYAATESRLKGTSLEESMTAEIGLAHMLQKYSEADVDKIAPAFSALSVKNPMSLKQQETAFGYAVPLLHAAMELDPWDVMASSTALARAGITSTKAGTWVREMMKGAMPGTSLMSKMRFRKHETALQELGLVDKNHKPTWFVDGKPNEMKFLEKVAENLPKIPIERRTAILEALSNTRGAGALAVLAETAVRDQLGRIRADINNPKTINHARNFMEVYNEQSSLQGARTSMQTFNVTMADLGDKVLPSVNVVLGNFKGLLEGIRNVLPNAKAGNGAATVGARAIEGAIAGGVYGGFGGPGGIAAGVIGGGVIGGIEGIAEQYMSGSTRQKLANFGLDKGGSYTSPGKTGKPAEKIVVTPPLNLSLNIDGQLLARVLTPKIVSQSDYPTAAPAFDGSGRFE